MSIPSRKKLLDSFNVMLLEMTYHRNHEDSENIEDRKVLWSERRSDLFDRSLQEDDGGSGEECS